MRGRAGAHASGSCVGLLEWRLEIFCSKAESVKLSKKNTWDTTFGAWKTRGIPWSLHVNDVYEAHFTRSCNADRRQVRAPVRPNPQEQEFDPLRTSLDRFVFFVFLHVMWKAMGVCKSLKNQPCFHELAAPPLRPPPLSRVSNKALVSTLNLREAQ